MNRIYLTVIISFVVIIANAQTQGGVLSLSREKAIEIAIQKRFDKKAQTVHSQSAQSAINDAKKQWLPDIAGTSETRYNPQLQKTIIPGGILPNYDKPSLLALGGAVNTSYINLSLEQSIYDKEKNIQLALSKNDYQSRLEKEKETEIQIKDEVLKAYLEILLKEFQYKIAEDIQERSIEYLKLSKAKFENGKIIENDYLRVKLDKDNADVAVSVSLQQYKLAKITLCFRLNLPAETKIELSENLNDIAAENKHYSLQQRTELRQSMLQIQKDSILLKGVKQNWFPKISFVANYTYQYQNEKYQFDNKGWWSPYSYLGLKATFPISNILKSKSDVVVKKLTLDESRLRYEHIQTEINFAVSKSISDIENARNNLIVAKANYELAQKIFKNHQQQFSLGMFDYSNLLDTERTLRTSEQQYTEAVYFYMLAYMENQKQTGNL